MSAIQCEWSQVLADAGSQLSLASWVGEAGSGARLRYRILEHIGQQVQHVLQSLLSEALRLGCPDIHFELSQDLVVFLRKDGELVQALRAPLDIGRVLFGRLRFLCGLPLFEAPGATYGRLDLEVGSHHALGRATLVRLPAGYRLVLRFLSQGPALGLEELGMSRSDAALVRQMASQPGLILISGPAGSGKTTTLYSVVAWLTSIRHHVITMEDPVERMLPGVTQLEFGGPAKTPLSDCFTSTLRLDPDVLAIGEIRDSQAAQIALRASLTGRPVLATIHARDCVESIYRLAEFGIDLCLVADAMNGSIGQRLVRPDSTGAGRLGVFQVIAMSSALKRAMQSGSGMVELRRLAVRSGLAGFTEEDRAV